MLTGHTDRAQRRRPVEPHVDRLSTPRRRRSIASPRCRMATSCPDRATTRSRSGTRRPAPASRHYAGTRAERGAGVQSNSASTPRLDATGAGLVRRRPVERRHRVRVARPHAQGLGRLCEDGTSGCPAPFTWNERQDGRASHRQVPLAVLVCLVPHVTLLVLLLLVVEVVKVRVPVAVVARRGVQRHGRHGGRPSLRRARRPRRLRRRELVEVVVAVAVVRLGGQL